MLIDDIGIFQIYSFRKEKSIYGNTCISILYILNIITNVCSNENNSADKRNFYEKSFLHMLFNRCGLALLCNCFYRFCNSCKTIRITCLTSKWHKVNMSVQQYRTKQVFTYYLICQCRALGIIQNITRPLQCLLARYLLF